MDTFRKPLRSGRRSPLRRANPAHQSSRRPGIAGEHPGRSSEQARIDSLLRLIPPGANLLEIGSRGGYITHLLTDGRNEVVALDLERPNIHARGISCVAGDVRELDFEADSFDVVLCSEVLEHIPAHDLARACGELVRVTRRFLVVGVPFAQDLRVARTRCAQCGAVNPPYGHVNRFTRDALTALFGQLLPVTVDYVGSTRERTNVLSDSLMRAAGYPWGSYGQDEPCIACGRPVGPAPAPRFGARVLAGLAHRLDRAIAMCTPTRPQWLHVVFEKAGPAERDRPTRPKPRSREDPSRG
jgi:ubiquinone/menaquinone biosynthesis C-methylase UbiE